MITFGVVLQACHLVVWTIVLAGNEQARRRFESLAPSYRREFIYWVAIAKHDETRRRRIEETIDLLMRDKRLGPK